MNNLFRICILLGAIGLSLIYASSVYVEPDAVEISEIKPQWTGKSVIVDGNVSQPYMTKGNLFFSLEDSNGSVKVAEFGSNRTIQAGKKVTVSGRVTLYRGSLEIIAEKIEK